MAHIVADRIRDTTTTTGTGPVALSGTPPATYKTFSARCAVNDTVQYFIAHRTADEFECGVATYTASNQLTRTTVYSSSNSDTPVPFSPGTKDVVLVQIAPPEIGFLWDPIVKSLTLTGGTITANNPLLNLTRTWNNAAVAFTAILLNITDTASAAGSLLMDLQVAGVSKLKVDKFGSVTAADQQQLTMSYFVFNGTIDGISSPTGARWSGRGGGTLGLLYQTDCIGLSINHTIAWANSARGDLALTSAPSDIGISRTSAGVLQLNRPTALTSPTGLQVYNTTDVASGAPTNYERGIFDWTSTANVLTIATQAGGSGVARDIRLSSATGKIQIANVALFGASTGTGWGIGLGTNVVNSKQLWLGDYDSFGSAGATLIRFVSGSGGKQTLAGVLGDGSAAAPITIGLDGGVVLGKSGNSALATTATQDVVSIVNQVDNTPQTLRVYNTTDGTVTNYERGIFDWTTTANVLTIGSQAGGSGTKRDVALWTSGVLSVLQSNAAPIVQFSNNGGTGGQVLCRDLGSMSFGGVDMSNSPLLQSQGAFPNSYVLALMDAQNNNQAVGFHVYNTANATVNPTNYERGVFDWTITANTLTIGSQSGGTGVSRDTQLVSSSAGTANAGTLIVANGFAGVSGSATVTVTIATPAVFSLTAHGYVPGQVLRFTTTGALPTGLSLATNYYVIAAGLTANAFEVSATPGGTAVNTSGTQSGTHTSVPQTSAQNPGSTVAVVGPSGLTGSQAISALSLAQTWNTSGAPAAIKLNVTNITNAGGLLIDLQVGGVSKFSVNPNGAITVPGASNASINFGSSEYIYRATTGLIIFGANLNDIAGVEAGASGLVTAGGLAIRSSSYLGWSSGLIPSTDTAIWRDASGIIAQRNFANAQGFRVYNTTDSGNNNYERGVFDWTTTANTLTIGTQAFGSGSARSINLAIGTQTIKFNTNGNILCPYNAGNGGISFGASPSDAYIFGNGTALVLGVNGNDTLGLQFGAAAVVISGTRALAWANGGNVFNGTNDVGISRITTGVLAVGNGAVADKTGWVQWGGQARVTADFSVTSSTTLVNVTGLSVTLQAGRTYSFFAYLPCTCAAAGGVKAAIGGTCTATNIMYDGYTLDTNTTKGQANSTALGGTIGSTTTTATTGLIIEIQGTITVNAAGTLTVQFAQNTSSGTASIVKRGAYLFVQDMP